ncbi:MAG: NBR1-Ig-like domain-containing protein [Anaerolineaceae bacterium]
MMINWMRSILLWLIIGLTFSGCTPSSTVDKQSPTMEIQATSTPFPTATSLPATATPTVTLLPSPTYTSTAPINQSTWTQETIFTFIGETIPDGTNLQPGQAFQKTWTLKNAGSRTWGKDFSLTRTSSVPTTETLGGREKIPLSTEVKPGEAIQVGVDLVAPKQNGEYTVYYQLQDETGSMLPNSQIWVTITVGSVPSAGTGGVGVGGTTTVNGVTVTLTDFAYDTQSVTVNLCFSVSLHYYTLGPAPSLLMDQEKAPFLAGGSDFASGPGCLEVMYQISPGEIEQTSHISLLIDSSLRISPPPGDPNTACEAAKVDLVETYPGLDFQCNYSMAGYATNIKPPSGMTRENAEIQINDAIEGAIYGPWTLTIK